MRFSISVVAILAALPHGLAVPTLLTPPDTGIQMAAAAAAAELQDNYIVVLKDEVDDVSVEEHEMWAAHINDNRVTRRHDRSIGFGRKFGFGKKLRGYTGRFMKETIDEIKKRPEVAYVEKDSVMSIYGLVEQKNAPWGLSRISHKVNNLVDTKPNGTDGSAPTPTPIPGTNQTYTTTPLSALPVPTSTLSSILPTGTGTAGRANTWDTRNGPSFASRWRNVARSILPRQFLSPPNELVGPYFYDESAGEGQVVYVIDTGVNIEHEEFEGRAKWGKTMISGAKDTDGQGHGTHVAGTVAGKTYGVAKKATVIAVKVLGDNGFGSNSDVIAGVNWVADEVKKSGKKAIVNMSLGGSYSRALNNAVIQAIKEAGLIFVVAAGNDDINAEYASPASVAEAITVGSTAEDDTRSYFSNYGRVVDVFAPGNNITSAWIGSKSATNTISGTSMAAPHVAGLAAYLLGLGETDVESKIRSQGVQGLVKDAKDSVNLFIYNGAN